VCALQWTRFFSLFTLSACRPEIKVALARLGVCVFDLVEQMCVSQFTSTLFFSSFALGRITFLGRRRPVIYKTCIIISIDYA
jgi:hypothetical protein